MSNVLSDITKAISKNSTTTPLNLPGINASVTGNLLEVIPEAGRTITELSTKISNAAANITQIVNQAYCIGEALTNPAMLLDLVGMVGNAASAIAKGIAERMTKLIKDQITQALSSITGTINGAISNVKGYIDQVSSFINELEATYKAIQNFKINISFDANIELKDFATQEDCEFTFAMMGACLLGKLMGNKLQEFEQKVSSQIINAGSSVNDAINDAMTDVGNVGNYVEKQKFMLQKAEKQLKGVNQILNKNAMGGKTSKVQTAATKASAGVSVSTESSAATLSNLFKNSKLNTPVSKN